MHIVFICSAYPSKNFPQQGVFVQQSAWAMARLGHQCTVISPISIFKKKMLNVPHDYFEKPDTNCLIHVFRPTYLSASSKKIGPFHSGRITQKMFEHCVYRTLKSIFDKADILYGVFLYQGGKAATYCGNKLAIPAVIEVGEGTFWTLAPSGIKRAAQELANTNGFRVLGHHLVHNLITNLQIAKEKITVIPNGVDRKLFHYEDKTIQRQKLKLDPKKFIVLFVGTFDHLKGGRELLAAVEQIPECYLVMIGAGPLKFSSKCILFKGLLPHEELPSWYQAADIFVLPTREEGSCNAAIEAMSCGLPIVTSNGEHMADIAGPENAITVDEKNVEAIKEAILKLKNDSALRETLSQGALKKAEQFTIDNRARELTAWFNTLVNRHE